MSCILAEMIKMYTCYCEAMLITVWRLSMTRAAGYQNNIPEKS